jgi:hypothetical protein
MSESEERENRIMVIDRRRFYLDDDGEVREREPEERTVDLRPDGARVERSEAPEPPTKEPFWLRLKRKLVGA